MGTGSEARNCTRITVNNNIYVFAAVRRLADQVIPIFDHAKAISPATSEPGHVLDPNPSRRRGSQPSSNTYPSQRQHELRSVRSPDTSTSPIGKPLQLLYRYRRHERPISGPKTSAQLKVRRAHEKNAGRTNGTRYYNGREGFVQLKGAAGNTRGPMRKTPQTP